MSKQTPDTDHENSHYDYPIPSREAIRSVLTDQPAELDDIIIALSVEPWAKEAVLKRLEAMRRDGQIAQGETGYHLDGQSKLVEVEVQSNKTGDLTVVIDGHRLLLSYRHSQGLFPHDKLIVRVPDPAGPRTKPIPVKVVESSSRQIVCYVDNHRGKKRLMPFDRRIKHILNMKNLERFVSHDVILVARADDQRNRRVLQVEFLKKLGTVSDAGIEREIARSLYHLARDWGDVDISQTQSEIDSQIAAREDWTTLPLVTIDGADAKDFDDAVYAHAHGKGHRLYVAIADVAYYVKEGDELDIAAKERGNSVYFPGFVIPMLPKQLSNNLCSLMPNVNRLAMGAVMDIDQAGNVTDFRAARVVIKSHARLIYQDVDQMIQDGKYPEGLQATIEGLDQVAKVLKAKRVEEGAIMFSSSELVFDFDDERYVKSIQSKERGWSHQLIEECMLCANRAVGRYLDKKEVAFIKRAHDAPNPDKVAALADYLKAMDIDLPLDPSPKDLQSALEAVPDYRRHEVESQLLRTMSQAHYSENDFSHYALSTDYYTHFTSPIRRYVDLTIHRALIAELEETEPTETDLDACAKACSLYERYADEAGWFCQAWLKAQYMQQYVGRSFMGKVCTVTHFGIFVTLEDMPVEGLVHISNLGDDHFVYDQESHCLRGRSSKKTFMQGKRIRIVVKHVDIITQQIDFILAKNKET